MSFQRTRTLPHRVISDLDQLPPGPGPCLHSNDEIECVGGQSEITLYLNTTTDLESPASDDVFVDICPYWYDAETGYWHCDASQTRRVKVGRLLYSFRIRGKSCRFLAIASSGDPFEMEVRYSLGLGL